MQATITNKGNAAERILQKTASFSKLIATKHLAPNSKHKRSLSAVVAEKSADEFQCLEKTSSVSSSTDTEMDIVSENTSPKTTVKKFLRADSTKNLFKNNINDEINSDPNYVKSAFNFLPEKMEELKIKLEKNNLLINFDDLGIYARDNKFSSYFIGRGGFGTVTFGVYKDMLIAIKELQAQVDECFFNEVSMMLTVRKCKNVLPLVGVCWEKRLIITPFKCSGNLGTFKQAMLKDPRTRLPMREMLLYMLEVAKGVESIHSLNPKVIHRDISLANILVESSKNSPCKIYICDFGISRSQNSGFQEEFHEYSPKGKRSLLPPEIVEGKPYNYKVDVYCFGLVLYKFLSTSFKTTNPSKKDLEIEFQDEDVRKLISQCLSKSPKERPNFRIIRKTLEKMIQKRTSKNSHCK